MSGELYKLFSVSRNATVNEIKASYRKLAMELHPDRNGNDALKTAKFRIISAAYEVLSDEMKRRDYDRTLGSSNGKRANNEHGQHTSFYVYFV